LNSNFTLGQLMMFDIYVPSYNTIFEYQEHFFGYRFFGDD